MESILKTAGLTTLIRTPALYYSPHGFFPRRSRRTTLLLAEHRVTELMDGVETVDLDFLVLAKAFD